MKARLALTCIVIHVLGACGISHPVDGDGGEEAGELDSALIRECTPGSTRVVECPDCGHANETCTSDGTWAGPGECVGTGACTPGDNEVESTDRCGARGRFCGDSCEWGDWEQMEPDGVCVPGEERTESGVCGPSAIQVEACTDACAWGLPSCVDLCETERRTTPAVAEEICIPAGDFVRGDENLTNAGPARMVRLSAYFIDRFPVTNGRYQACVAAGICTEPVIPEGRASLSDPTRARHPVQGVSRTQALGFCGWDGGRTLPTEAQWEKAARGPSPRAQEHTWEGLFDCVRVLCEAAPPALLPFAVDEVPATASYYGVEMLLAGGYEWTRDLYSPFYYGDDSSLIDPTGPSSGGYYVCRGQPIGTNSATAYNISSRWICHDDSIVSPSTFRCARAATME